MVYPAGVFESSELQGEKLTDGDPPQHVSQANLHVLLVGQRAAEDIALAQSLLADAGFPNGEGFPTVDLLTRETPDIRIQMAAIQAMISEGLNIDSKIKLADASVYGEQLVKRDFDVSGGGWAVGLTDPAANIVAGLGQCAGKPCSQNFSGWNNAEFNALIDQLTEEANLNARLGIVDEMNEILLDEWPVMPLGAGFEYWAYWDHVKGVVPGDFTGDYELHMWDDVWLLKK